MAAVSGAHLNHEERWRRAKQGPKKGEDCANDHNENLTH